MAESRCSVMFIAVFLSSLAWAQAPRSICGTDSRQLSSEPRSGQLLKDPNSQVGCTASLVGRSCAVSAGHCTKQMHQLRFNKSVDGTVRPEDVYEVDRASIVYRNSGVGVDFAVFRAKPNRITGKSPGDVQGHYGVGNEAPQVGQELYIAGYGKSENPARSYRQQSDSGEVLWISRAALGHDVDTDNGSSGAGLIVRGATADRDELIGVHTNGGCHGYGGANIATSILLSRDFRQAYLNCLVAEAQETGSP